MRSEMSQAGTPFGALTHSHRGFRKFCSRCAPQAVRSGHEPNVDQHVRDSLAVGHSICNII